MKGTASYEINGFVYCAVGVAALGGLFFGYDTGVISGAILSIKNQFSLSAAMVEIVVSSVLVGAVMGAVTVTNWALNVAVAITFLTLVGVLGHAGTFWLYGAIAIGAWVFFYLLVPETKGKTLEQIEEHWRSGTYPQAL